MQKYYSRLVKPTIFEKDSIRVGSIYIYIAKECGNVNTYNNENIAKECAEKWCKNDKFWGSDNHCLVYCQGKLFVGIKNFSTQVNYSK